VKGLARKTEQRLVFGLELEKVETLALEWELVTGMGLGRKLGKGWVTASETQKARK
jgi:hypothetical protein